MPILSNGQHERFCHELIDNGGNAAAAYAKVFNRNTRETACRTGACKLKKKLAARIREIQEDFYADKIATRNELLAILCNIARRGEKDAARVTAAVAAAKLCGYEPAIKHEHSGAVTAFIKLDDIRSKPEPAT